MALNKLMHPRNIYKTPPDFKQLAIEYDEFRQHATQDLTGKVHIDFKDPNALRSLTRTLLKKDFGLDVEIPPDRLIPTVPQRLNYVLWMEDLLQDNDDPVKRGIDIGTGASCIFPLLGSSKNGWHFLATESDQGSFDCATRNVQRNKLEDKVKVIRVTESSSLQVVLSENQDSVYHFCMCNPPFFCDSFDASWESKSRKRNREGPKGANTASPAETITEGGEVEFVKKIVADSLELKEKVKIYSTMLGKKNSVAVIKEHLKQMSIPHFITTEFQQGKTLRWGVAWTFCTGLKLNKISIPKAFKPVKPLSFFIPSTLKCTTYSVLCVLEKIEEWLKELDVLYLVHERKETTCKLWIRSNNNTWSHQRRKRREIKRENVQSEGNVVDEVTSPEKDQPKAGTSNGLDTNPDKQPTNCQTNCTGLKRKSSEAESDEHEEIKRESSDLSSAISTKELLLNRTEHEKPVWLLFADVSISLAGKCIMLEMKARREMESRETLHQIMQFLKNRLV